MRDPWGKRPFQSSLSRSASFAKMPRATAVIVPCPRGRTSFGSCPGTPRAHSGQAQREVSTAGPWTLPLLRVTHRLVWGHELGTHSKEAGGVVLGLAEPSRSGVAHWCTAAWGRRSGRSCWPGCSCSPLRRRAAGRPGAVAAAAAAGAAPP